MFLHAVWRPMLAGAVGAALIVATVWAAMPKFHYNDIEIPRVIVHDRDVTVDHVVPRDVPVDHVVPHEVPVDHIVPHDAPMPGPQASASPKPAASAPPDVSRKVCDGAYCADAQPKPPMGPDSPYAPKTADEKKFTDKPAYKNAAYHGRIVKSRDCRELSFEDGKDFHPGHWDNVAGHGVSDDDAVIDSDPYVGDLGMCVADKDHKQMWDCTAMHNGQVIYIPYKSKGTSAASPQPPANSSGPTPAAQNMVEVDVDVAGYPVRAMVDTGCSWPMAIPRILADTLVREGLAALTSPAKSMLADGKVKDVDVIVINQITVDGRTLQDVLASVAPGDDAPILLGLGALNRLGQFSITDGRIVFTGDQPA